MTYVSPYEIVFDEKLNEYLLYVNGERILDFYYATYEEALKGKELNDIMTEFMINPNYQFEDVMTGKKGFLKGKSMKKILGVK